jgi:hypothetical protein
MRLRNVHPTGASEEDQFLRRHQRKSEEPPEEIRDQDPVEEVWNVALKSPHDSPLDHVLR